MANSEYGVSYQYDAAGRRSRLTYPGAGEELTYAYHYGSLPDTITRQDNTEVLDIDRDVDSLAPTAKRYYNDTVAVAWDYKHDAPRLGLVDELRVGGTVFQLHDYNDRMQRIRTGQWQNAYTRDYAYDNLGRLESATPMVGSADKFELETFDLDAFENRSGTAYVDGRPVVYSGSATENDYVNYDDSFGAHELLGAAHYFAGTGLPPTGSFTYVLNRARLDVDARHVYQWDSFNRICRVSDVHFDSVGTLPHYVTYYYDAFGRRVAHKYTGGVNLDTVKWADRVLVYDGTAVIEEHTLSDGLLQDRYYYEDGLHRLALVKTGATEYVPLIDERGTVMGLTNTTGTVQEKLYYNSTGLIKAFDGLDVEKHAPSGLENIARSEFVPFGWTGMYKDRFTGLYHTHFREYDPVHGRWLSEDPAGYQDGLNLYAAYMGINDVDPIGLFGAAGVPVGIWDNYLETRKHDPLTSGIIQAVTDPAFILSDLYLETDLTQTDDAMVNKASTALAYSEEYGYSGVDAWYMAVSGITADAHPVGEIARSLGGEELVSVAPGVLDTRGLGMGERVLRGTFGTVGSVGSYYGLKAGVNSAVSRVNRIIPGIRTSPALTTVTPEGNIVIRASTSQASDNARNLPVLAPREIAFPAKRLTQRERDLFRIHLLEQETELNRLSVLHTDDLTRNLVNFRNVKQLNNRARSIARSYLPGNGTGLDAAHRLDSVAGGFMNNFAGFRDPRTQQLIGSLWRTRVDDIAPGRLHRLTPVFLE